MKRRRGAASIEFALLMPFTVVLLAGVIDGGSYMVERAAAGRAARDGARVGAMTLETSPVTGAKIEAAAKAAAQASMVAAGFSGGVTVTTDWYQESSISWLRVDVTCSHSGFFGHLTPFGTDPKHTFYTVTQEQP